MEEQTPDLKKLAKDFSESIVSGTDQVRATLFLDGQFFANGTATVSDVDVLFCPETPKQMETVLHDRVSLKVSGNDVSICLLHSREHLTMSSDIIWCFGKIAA